MITTRALVDIFKGTTEIQLWTNKVIKFDSLRMRIFIEILTSDSESEASKTFRKGVVLFFPHLFGRAKFLGLFNASKSQWNQPSLDQLCAICDPHVTCCVKKKNQANCVFLWEA